jgi:hypothetical protein
MAHLSTDTVYGIGGWYDGGTQQPELDNRDLGTTEVRIAEYPNVVFDISPMFALDIVENAIENTLNELEDVDEFRHAVRILRQHLDTEEK